MLSVSLARRNDMAKMDKRIIYILKTLPTIKQINQAIRNAVKVQFAELTDIVQLVNVFNAFK